MNRIKVLRIIARLNIGGPAIHTVLLTEGLDKARFDSLLICGNIGKGEGDMSYYAKEKGVSPIYVSELKREIGFLNDIVAFIKIYRIIRREKPNIVHTHTAKAGTIGRLAGIFYNLFIRSSDNRIKLIHTFHGHIFEGYFSKIKTGVFLLIERVLSRFTSKIITVSDSIKRELCSLGVCRADKIAVIPLGFELDKFFDIPIKDDDIFNIGIVGRLVPVKNHRLFLEAAAKTLKSDERLAIKTRFKIFGDGELRKMLEEYSYKLKIGPYVDFLGWQKDLVKVYSNLDIVALTSLNEGTPVSLIEAMACGRAIVATDVGGIADLLGKEIADLKPNIHFKVLERGIVVESGDRNSFSAALIFLAQNKEIRKNMALSSRDFVKNNFSKERLIKDIESLYENMV